MKYYVRRKTCKLNTNYIYHKMYTCFFLNSRLRKNNLHILNKKENLSSMNASLAYGPLMNMMIIFIRLFSCAM